MKQGKSSREWFFRIEDIVKAIEKIESYIDSMTLAEFKKNQLIIDAVVRNFEIIGEASNHIPKNIKLSNPEIQWVEMYGMRNILIHEYFGFEVDTVWYTAKNHLPNLKLKLMKILDKAIDDYANL